MNFSKISKLPFVKHLFVQPAASDRGLALGCALYGAYYRNEKIAPINHVFYGPKINNKQIENSIKLSGFKSKHLDDPAEKAAKFLVEGKILAWFQGKSEFGPRALGHRSILADPGYTHMKDLINSKVKFREEFRPFAPSVLEEKYKSIFSDRRAEIIIMGNMFYSPRGVFFWMIKQKNRRFSQK